MVLYNPIVGKRKVATGTYTGNGAARQITVGFKCLLFIVIAAAGGLEMAVALPGKSLTLHGADVFVDEVAIHASDGLSLEGFETLQFMNTTGEVYNYIAAEAD